MSPKSPLTLSQVFVNASRLYRSSSRIVSSIIDLSLSTVAIIFLSACSFFSTLTVSASMPYNRHTYPSIMFITFVLTFFPLLFWLASSSRHCATV